MLVQVCCILYYVFAIMHLFCILGVYACECANYTLCVLCRFVFGHSTRELVGIRKKSVSYWKHFFQKEGGRCQDLVL